MITTFMNAYLYDIYISIDTFVLDVQFKVPKIMKSAAHFKKNHFYSKVIKWRMLCISFRRICLRRTSTRRIRAMKLRNRISCRR